MENLLNKIIEFSNYLLNNNIVEEQKMNIEGVLILSPPFIKINFVKFLRPENELENKTVIEKDKDGNDVEVKKYSQLKEWINVFGLVDNENVKNELKNYLDYFLTVKNNL